MLMLLGTAASESNRLNQRTRSFWLPGLVSLTAATLFLFAADIVSDPFLFFSQITLHPQDLLANGTALVLLRVAPRPSLVRSGRSAVLSSRWWNPHLTHRRRRVARNHLRRNLRCVDPLHLDVFGKRRDFASSYLLGVINVRVGRGPRTRPALRRRPIPERNRTQTSLELNSPMP